MKTKCPICSKPVIYNNNPYRPFCSERCKLIDLGNWVDGVYSLPAEEVEHDTKDTKNLNKHEP